MKNLQPQWLKLAICIAIGVVLWFIPAPEGISSTGWHYLSVFISVIVSFVLTPMPMGAMVLLSLLVLGVTQTARLDALLSGYGNKTNWLVVSAFLIAAGVRTSGLGQRIALTFASKLGNTILGLAYSICFSELLLGPVVPSNTARGGGILSPIVRSMSEALDSYPDKNPQSGAYLIQVGAHANLITAAMFLTGMAANPLVAEAAQTVYGVKFDWMHWATGAVLPGIVGLMTLPLFLGMLLPKGERSTTAAKESAIAQLNKLGKWSKNELLMLTVFIALIIGWTTSSLSGFSTTLIALLGVGALILTGVLPWNQVVKEHTAWDTFMWLGGLLAMANGLKDEGVITWFATNTASFFQQAEIGTNMLAILIGVAYFYSMYGFSMLSGHVAAFAGVLFAVAISANIPELLMVALVAYFSNLCGCLTNYSTGPVIIYYGNGYLKAPLWFKTGFLVSLFHMVIWLGIGLAWWKILGWY